MATPTRPAVELIVDGRPVAVVDESSTLLEVLRAQCGIATAKDGCSPQGQCGCCTVLVDGQARVACVTPVRRIAGRVVTTLDGLEEPVRRAWADAFASTGASQCGFCTPGIICRFESLRAKGATADDRAGAAKALLAHLCRCTGWQTILDAWAGFDAHSPDARPGAAVMPDGEAATRRASLEGRSPQSTGAHVAGGRGGFADDLAPSDALVAVRSPTGGWAVGETLDDARTSAGKIQGRRTTSSWEPPVSVPDGAFDVTLQTGWVEPGYLETDASWCLPGGEPASPLGNGGAFGGKQASPLGAAARALADEHGRAVRVLWSREDVTRYGPKRPPLAAGVNADGTGVVRVARTPGIVEAIGSAGPRLEIHEIEVAGPPTSSAIRGAGWAEAVALLAGARGEVGWVHHPEGGEATATIDDDGTVRVRVRAGEPLDETVLRSYCTGAAHMALSWVTSESLTVDGSGDVHDLTIRSFGILRAIDTPRIEVSIEADDRDPVNGSDAVFGAVAAAVWIDRGTPTRWPTG